MMRKKQAIAQFKRVRSPQIIPRGQSHATNPKQKRKDIVDGGEERLCGK